MIEERKVKVERMARAKYDLFEHDNLEEMVKFSNADEFVLSEMRKDKELNELKYQFWIGYNNLDKKDKDML